MDGSPITGEPHTVAYVAVFLDIPKPTLYRWMQRGDLPYEDYGGLTDRHISIEDGSTAPQVYHTCQGRQAPKSPEKN